MLSCLNWLFMTLSFATQLWGDQIFGFALEYVAVQLNIMNPACYLQLALTFLTILFVTYTLLLAKKKRLFSYKPNFKQDIKTALQI